MAHNAHTKPVAGKPSERRFTAEPTGRSNIQALVGGLGVAALGAGSYAAWVPEVAMDAAPYLFAAGVAGVIAALLISERDADPLRVGDAGVAIERGGAPERVGWYEVQNVSVDADSCVVVEGAGKRLVASPPHHAQAAAWIVKEALERIPRRVTIAVDRAAQIAGVADDSGHQLLIESMQFAGRRCKASGVIISFEEDARVCARCGEVYDKKHEPERCLTCEAPMVHRAA